MKISRLVTVTLLVGAGLLGGQSGALASGGTKAPTGPPTLSTVSLNVINVTGGAPAVGTVRLTSSAGAGGLTVALSSDNTAAATVPASVTVPSGATSATFPVTTLLVGNPQSALIIGSAGTVTTYAIITAYPPSALKTGSVAIIPGGTGNGTITSQPAGISCTVGANVGGTCSAFYPAGTVVRLTATAAPGSKFQGWRGLPGCSDPSRITVAAATTIYCQPSFSLR